MKFKSVLSNLDKELGSRLEVRRYTLPGMISESYNTLYSCESGTNMHKLVESHLEDVKQHPADVERLSRQLAIIKEVQRLAESGEIKDEDLDAATASKYEGDVDEKVSKEREEKLAPTEDIKESMCEEEDLLEDTELTDEEVEELTKHLAEIRKAKKVTESETPAEEEELDEVKYYEPTKEEAAAIITRIQRKFGSEISEEDYLKVISDVLGEDDVSTDIIDYEREKAGIKIIGESVDEARDFDFDQDLWAVVKDDGSYAGVPCITEEEAWQLAINHGGSAIFKLVPLDKARESKTYESLNLADFRKKSAGKAFIKTFKKLDKQLHEGTALSRQDAISLYKAANSAMTHLSVELEHNPEFLETFKESASLLSADVSKLLECMKNGKAPSKATMKSLAKFSEALLREAEEEEEIPVEDEEDILTAEEETTEEEVDEFDQEYAEARVELHKELAKEHEEEEDPTILDKLAKDAEEVASLPGVTEEQVAEILPAEEVVEEEPKEEVEETTDPAEEEIPDLELDDEEITDDELAELKKHLRELRDPKKVVESTKGRKLSRRAK